MGNLIGEIKNFLRKILEVKPFLDNGLFYSEVKPYASYSPWLQDLGFIEIFNRLESKTLIDKFRLFEIYEISSQLIRRFPGSSIAEVGVWRGGSALLLNEVRKNCLGTGEIYLFDTFTGVAKTTEKDHYYHGGEHSDTSKQFVDNLFENEERVRIFQGVFPEDTGKFIDNAVKFSVVHIDVDVYESCKDIIFFFKNKMVSGGVIIIDDYGFRTCNGVTVLIDEIRKMDLFLVVHNLNGHALLVCP